MNSGDTRQDPHAVTVLNDPPSGISPEGDPRGESVEPQLMNPDSTFYYKYPWCLNAFPLFTEVVEHLRQELDKLGEKLPDWQRTEVMTNGFLLSCAITDTVDDYLLGDSYDLSKARAFLPFAGPGVRVVEKLLTVSRNSPLTRRERLRGWREDWQVGLDQFLRIFVAKEPTDRNDFSQVKTKLTSLLAAEFPNDLRRRRPRIPAAFRSQDLTHFDILTLGQKFAATFPERGRPVLVVGLRTAGSYFAPLLSAHLRVEGYENVASLTIRPKKGIARCEHAQLARAAKDGGLALLIDEPPNSGGTLGKAVELLRKAGFPVANVVVLLPVHPTRRDWRSGNESLPFAEACVLPLEPEEWHKRRLLQPEMIERQLREFFGGPEYRSASLMAGSALDALNSQLEGHSEEKFHTRLKRIYQVSLEDDAGQVSTRYVLAKSVGWGWFGYHAFIAADQLSQFVPPLLGLREGILYTEWLPQGNHAPPSDQERGQLVTSIAAYVAKRVCSLGLGRDPALDLSRDNRQKGVEELATALRKAYGWKVATLLKHGRILYEISRHPCTFPTLIDGKMRRTEWIQGPSGLLKTDFEHHGLGKTELNVTDPAFDLAQAILHWGLSQTEERQLVGDYIGKCGDTGVEERLFLNKLLVGTHAMAASLANLNDERLILRHAEFNKEYVNAWNFLTLHTARFCGSLYRKPETLRWLSPLVVLDIDGVLDKQIFGFPSTTAAGVKAVSFLHSHGFAMATNTARTLLEVKEYCNEYGFVGGVGEYGSAIWDAIGERERVLVSRESLDQLETLRNALRQIPGVFLNDSYQYSIRAYTYERERTVPLPTSLIRDLMASMRVGRLRFLQTYIDTTVLAKEIDKGKGLLALLEWIGLPDIETLAIGDSEPDLAMFHVAKRCFAPAQISCRQVARLLGCQIADRPYQPGLLSIVRSLVHPDGARCDRCQSSEEFWPKGGGLFLKLLEVADQKEPRSLFQALLDPMALKAFEK